VLALELGDVVRREQVVAIGVGLYAHVDDDGARQQAGERNLVCRLLSFAEVNRGVEVRATVFGRAEFVRRVEPATWRLSVRLLRMLERFCGRRPVDGLCVERMRQVDELISGQVDRCVLGRLCTSDGNEDG
jgi:hypothetical protein